MSRARLLLLLLSAAAILLREPRFLFAPRFFGEDGTNYYRFAFQNHWLDALLYLPVNGPGYYSFVQDAAAAFAVAIGPPEWSAQVFLWLSLLAQLSPVLVVLFGRSYVWNTTGKQALVCALIVFSPASRVELWLNLVIAMNHFGLAALCVLMEDLRPPVGRVRAWGLRLLLVVGGLTGPWVVALTPLFLLKAWRERSREAWVHLGLMLAACLVQGAVVLTTVSQGSLDRERVTAAAPAMMLNVAGVAHVLRPLFGSLVDRFVDAVALRPALRPGGDTAVYLHGLLLMLPLLLGVAALIAPPPSRWQRWALLGGLCISSVVASLGAYGVAVGRYGFIPGLAVALLLVDNLGEAATRWQRLRRVLSAAVLAVTLGTGVLGWHEYRTDPDWEPDYRSWSDEVAAWRADPTHLLACMPSNFQIDLQRRGIASDLKADLKTLEGEVLSPGGRTDLLLQVRGVPSFGRVLFEVETALAPEALVMSVEFLLPDGEVVASGRMAHIAKRSAPGRMVLVDGLRRPRGLLFVSALRFRLQSPTSGDAAITIRRACYGDELLFF